MTASVADPPIEWTGHAAGVLARWAVDVVGQRAVAGEPLRDAHELARNRSAT